MLVEQESKAFNEFVKVLHNEVTRKQYVYYLNKYLAWSNKGSYDRLVSQDLKEIQISLENYCAYLQSENHKREYLKLTFSSLSLFFGMNYKEINKTRLRKMIQPQEGLVGGLAYSNDDVKKIILAIDKTKLTKKKKKSYPTKTKTRTRAIVHFLAASGCRVGALPFVRLKDLGRIDNCYSIKIYPGSPGEYSTFLTPEASKVLDEYLKQFKVRMKDHEYIINSRRGEKVLTLEESPIFGSSLEAIRLHLSRMVRRAGLNQGKKGKRYDKPLAHAFRKRWNTIMKSNKEINQNLIELMMGHSTTIKLDKHYLKPTTEKLFDEYKKGIDELTLFKDTNTT